MKRPALGFLVLLAAQTALAQNAVDVAFSGFRPKKTLARTGEDFTMRVNVANRGPDDAPDVRMTISGSELNTLYTGVDAPAGWDCGPQPYTSTIDCSIATLPAGADHELRVRMFIPMHARGPELVMTGRLFHDGFERDSSDNFKVAKIAVYPSETRINLELHVSPLPKYPIGTDAMMLMNVTNSGPHDARNVLVVFTRGPNAPLPMHAQGDGWACEAAGAEQIACTRPLLAANTEAPISFRVPMSLEQEGRWYTARGTAELADDATLPWAVLAPRPLIPEKTYQQILIPLISTGTPGADGALWKNELRMIVDRPIEIHPNLCDFAAFCDRAPIPVGQPFDPRDTGMLFLDPNWRGGQFLYVNSADAQSLRLGARVYDASRDSEGAGAEIPIPREGDFTSDPIALFDIPLAPELRHNLRIYDANGRSGTLAIIHVYVDDETVPRATVEYGLRTLGNLRTSTSRPVRPAYVEVDPTQFADLAGAARMRVEIQPRNGTDRLWAFLTVTSIETHQVTAFTPQ